MPGKTPSRGTSASSAASTRGGGRGGGGPPAGAPDAPPPRGPRPFHFSLDAPVRQVAHESPHAEVPRLPHGVEPETHTLHPAGEHQAAAYTLVRNRCLRRPHLRARGLTSPAPALPARVNSR